jgi:7-cyano-7-deazaguanine tRNA-ribosyltransferase
MLSIVDIDLAGRIGKLKLKRGIVETPAFFPVIDPARQELSVEDIKNAGFNQVITNAYLLLKKFGEEAIKRGVHGILGFDGIVMTDSGAYQILEYGGIEFEQEAIIEYQKAIGSDIGVILDIPTGDVDYERAKDTVKATLRRALDALRLIEGSSIAWVLPVQGGRYLDLVEYSAREASRIPYYSIYGIGSPTEFLERYEFTTVLKMVYSAKKHLPDSKPVHLFGAGHPLILPFAVALGVDMFDSASYILYARDGRYMTEYGVYRVEDLEYLPCSCPVCSRVESRDFLEVSRDERVKLLALHNLYVIRRALMRVKQAIREGRLWEYLEEISRKHPRAMEAFKVLRRFYKYLELRTPLSKGRVYGVKLYGFESIWNPKVLRFRLRSWRVIETLLGEVEEVLLKPLLGGGGCLEGGVGLNVIYYTPYIGLIPSVICSVYPSTQHVRVGSVDPEALEDLTYSLRSIVAKARGRGVKLRVGYCSSYSWTLIVAREAEALGLDVVELC